MKLSVHEGGRDELSDDSRYQFIAIKSVTGRIIRGFGLVMA